MSSDAVTSRDDRFEPAQSEADVDLELLGRSASVYRAAALRARSAEFEAEALPRFCPNWARRFLWWLCSPLLLAPLLLALPIDDTVAGSAHVRVVDAHEIRADGMATITSVLVVSGAVVRRGDVLLRVSDAAAQAQLASAFADFRAALLQRLAEPQSEANAAQVAQARERFERISRDAAARAIRAPIDGRVLDLGVVAGQALQPGQSLITLAPQPTRYALEIAVPARHRAQLAAGQSGSFLAQSAEPQHLEFRVVGVDDMLHAEHDAGKEAQLLLHAELAPGANGVYAGQAGRASVTLGRMRVFAWLWRALRTG